MLVPTLSLTTPWEGYKKKRARLFGRVCCDKTRRNYFKLEEGRFILDIKIKFSMIRAVKH